MNYDRTNTHFYYLRDKNNKPFGCICLIVDKEHKLYLFGISICHKNEVFEKARARDIAFSRAYNQDPNKSYSSRMPGAKFKFGLHYFLGNECIPERAKVAIEKLYKDLIHE